MEHALAVNSESGQGLVEYALILVLVAIVVIAVLVIWGPQIGNIFSRVTTGVTPGTGVHGSGSDGTSNVWQIISENSGTIGITVFVVLIAVMAMVYVDANK